VWPSFSSNMAVFTAPAAGMPSYISVKTMRSSGTISRYSPWKTTSDPPLLIGFFLPGDSLLFTAGLLCTATSAHKQHLSLPVVILAAAAGALLGAQTGFYAGRTGGRRLLDRNRNGYLGKGTERARELLARYGHGKAIVLARFIPVVRTVLNPLAGALGVRTRTFTSWQVAGGLVWSVGVTLAGYALGSAIPSIDNYLLPVIAAIVVVSLIPIGIELRRTRAAAGRSAGDANDAPALPSADQAKGVRQIGDRY
jgi:membrane-associated protein